MTALSLYLHIPFCTKKCGYCDFFSVPARSDDTLIGRYVDALLKETERRLLDGGSEVSAGESEVSAEGNRNEASADKNGVSAGGLVVPSLYIGGGTPSLLGAGGIARLLDGVCALTGGSPGEITVEANPETADSSFLRACADHGVSRLSLGVQSFDQGFREALGRGGGTQQVSGTQLASGTQPELLSQRLSEAAEIFGRRLSVDILCGGLYPENGSSAKQRVLRDIDKALSYGPGHVSLYALTLEEGTPLAARLAAVRAASRLVTAASRKQKEDDAIWLAGRDALTSAGFDHYEISNFALRDSGGETPINCPAGCSDHGYRCIHNIRYWRMNNWIGVGPGASGTSIGNDGTGRRTSYAPDVEGFLSGRSTLVTEELDRPTVIKETLLMGYRYVEGPDPALFVRRFGKTLEEAIPRTLAKWQGGNDAAVFHERRMLFLNPFLLDAFLELDNTYK